MVWPPSAAGCSPDSGGSSRSRRGWMPPNASPPTSPWNCRPCSPSCGTRRWSRPTGAPSRPSGPPSSPAKSAGQSHSPRGGHPTGLATVVRTVHQRHLDLAPLILSMLRSRRPAFVPEALQLPRRRDQRATGRQHVERRRRRTVCAPAAYVVPFEAPHQVVSRTYPLNKDCLPHSSGSRLSISQRLPGGLPSFWNPPVFRPTR